MNCTDSVLNSDELPVRGIDQCPSTLSAQPSPGLVLVKWNRLPALFTTARLNSCFVEAEAFLKCVNLLAIQKDYFFSPPFHSVNSLLLILEAFFSLLPQICSLKILDVLDLKLSDSWHFFVLQNKTKKKMQKSTVH